VLEAYIATRWTKEGNASADDDRDARHGHTIDQPRLQKTLNGGAAIDVQVRPTPFRESTDDVESEVDY
jgi:hypothetical protein